MVRDAAREHALAKAMAQSRNSKSKPDCCNRRGILWDLIAVYPAGAIWSHRLSAATVFNGPVVRVIAGSNIL